jgi:hypothetical protein
MRARNDPGRIQRVGEPEWPAAHSWLGTRPGAHRSLLEMLPQSKESLSTTGGPRAFNPSGWLAVIKNPSGQNRSKTDAEIVQLVRENE